MKERAELSCPFPDPFSSRGNTRGWFATHSPAEEVQGLFHPPPCGDPVAGSPQTPQELIHICPNSELSRIDSKCSCFDL